MWVKWQKLSYGSSLIKTPRKKKLLGKNMSKFITAMDNTINWMALIIKKSVAAPLWQFFCLSIYYISLKDDMTASIYIQLLYLSLISLVLKRLETFANVFVILKPRLL